MPKEHGLFHALLGFGLMFGRIGVADQEVALVSEASKQGSVVYALPSRSLIDYLALSSVLQRGRLPLAVWARGVGTALWGPIGQGLSGVIDRVKRWWSGQSDDPVESGALTASVSSGQSVVVWLDEPKWFASWRAADPDAFAALLSAAEGGAPVFVVPTMIAWERRPTGSTSSFNFFSANARRSGIRRLLDVYWRSSEAHVRMGKPIDLTTLVARVDAERRGTVLRTWVRRSLAAEEKLVAGPRLLSASSMRRLVLETPPMRELARQEAAAQGVSVEAVQGAIEKEYNAIAARFSWATIRFLDIVLRPLWTRVFSGVDVRDEDIERLRTAMRDGTPILVPCHKSHFDYLLLSWVCFEHGLIMPHVVAGMNLAIPVVATILRGAGGFFIRRKFAGQRIHPVVFSRYLRELIRQEYPVEFFIEGGRTRSGKLLGPRLGVLSMVMEAAELRSAGREVTLLPIALAYEQVAEEGAYAAELGGAEKRPESVGQLVKARSVFSRRFGRVYLRIGEPIHCSKLVDASEAEASWSERAAPSRQATLQRTGDTIVHRIGQAMVVLPTSVVAMALLSHHRRGISDADLMARCERLFAWLQRCGATPAERLSRPNEAWRGSLDRFVKDGRIEALDHAGQRVWSIGVDERITLDFYKNQILQFFSAAGLATAAIRARPEGTVSLADLHGPFCQLLWHWRREFVFDPGESATSLLKGGLAQLVAHGALEAHDEGWRVVDPARMGEIYGMFRPLLEAYRLVLDSVEHTNKPLHDRDGLIRVLQNSGEKLLGAGSLTWPEGLSLITLKNAIDVLREDGVFTRDDDGRLCLVAEQAGPATELFRSMAG